MQTKLISITQTNEFTAEELIVYIARVSNPQNQNNMQTADKLLNYMIKHKHWSPFEMVDMTVEIKTSRAIAQQILRHRSFSFQEFSQRYSNATEFEPIELRKQADKNRQSSSEVIGNKEISDRINEYINLSYELYNNLIAGGVARESARMILPLTTQTTMYMKGSVRSWIHYLEIRTKDDTQKEHRLIAQEIKEIFKENFPVITDALNWNYY